MKRIIYIVLISVLVALLFQVLSIYRILSASSYQIFNLENIQSIFQDSGEKTLTMRIDNPTNRRMSIQDVSITFEKQGRTMGGFMPVDLKLVPGVNNLQLQLLNDTRFGLIATDYILNKLSDYKLVIRGNWLGIIPFRYKMNMNTLIS